tara:strand:- start:96 stop:467 length:372 start_codon:yes stop_codon:yes gene_type:complete
MNFWKTENKLEPKNNFQSKIEKYYSELAGEIIPVGLVNEIINDITDDQYETYQRFWKQYPKSRKRYSELKIDDLEHPFTRYKITDLLKKRDKLNYRMYSKILLKMNDDEFDNYEQRKHQYETK